MTTIDVSKKIKQAITAYLSPLKSAYSTIKFDFDVDEFPDSENVYCLHFNGYRVDKYQQNSPQKSKMLYLYLLEDCKQIHITNFILPEPMHKHNFGLDMVNEIRKISLECGYELFIVDMVSGFYRRMLNRGASPCNGCNDAVCVTKDTDLKSHY